MSFRKTWVAHYGQLSQNPHTMFHDSAHCDSVNVGHQHISIIFDWIDCSHHLEELRVFLGRTRSSSQGRRRKLRVCPEATSRDDPMLRYGLMRVSAFDAYQVRLNHRCTSNADLGPRCPASRSNCRDVGFQGLYASVQGQLTKWRCRFCVQVWSRMSCIHAFTSTSSTNVEDPRPHAGRQPWEDLGYPSPRRYYREFYVYHHLHVMDSATVIQYPMRIVIIFSRLKTRYFHYVRRYTSAVSNLRFKMTLTFG